MLISALPSIFALTASASLAISTGIQSHEHGLSAKELEKVERAVENAVNEAIEEAAIKNTRRDRQLQFCRSISIMPENTDWTVVANRQFEQGQDLGKSHELIENCWFYLHGEGDVLERQVLEEAQ